MKKIQIILILLAISLFFSSCARRFSPMYYYNKKASSSNSESDSTPSDIAGDEDIPPDQDPFINGEWNDINYRFDGNKISEFLFGASFDGNNVPIYKFYKKDAKTWELQDTLTSEYYFNGSDDGNKAQTYNINPANFYRYNYKNPLVEPTSGYNQSTRMGRFLFYRLKGKAVVVSLNNYLIAIDTHSKLVFAYAKITKTGEAVGQKYPTEFEAVELHGEKRKFYEYDPIGFMSYDASTDSLKLTLYREYQNEMAKDANAYFPQIHDPSREIAGYNNENSAGRSPYYMVAIEDIDPQTIMEQLKGKTYGIRDRLNLYTYKFSSNGLTLTLTIDHYYDGKIEKSYNCSKEVVGATSLKYGELTITGLGTYDKIKDGAREYILNYQDNGPSFVNRVAGKIYKAEDGNYEYKFSQDGNTIQYYQNGDFIKTYTFSAEYKDSDKAEYKEGGNMYWGLKLDNTKGSKDDTLYWSYGYSPIAGATSAISHYAGYLNVNIISGGFVENVKGKTYKFRDYSEYSLDNPLPYGYQTTGKSLTLYTYEFTANAQTLTIKEEIWGGKTKTTIYKIKSSADKSAVYDSNGKTINLSLKYDNETLYNGEQPIGSTSFIDEGPIFLDRVKDNPTFKYNDNTYIFKDGGKTIEWNGNTWTLYRYDNESKYKNRAIYKYTEMWGLIPVPWYYGVELSGDNDSTIKSTPKGDNNTVQWWLLGDEAYRQK